MSVLSPELLRIACCPRCRGGRLSSEGGVLVCSSCGRQYPVRDGVPDLRAVDVGHEPHGQEWLAKLDLLDRWWREAKLEPSGSAWRASPWVLQRYFDLAGKCRPGRWLLDVGCGEGHRARHFGVQRYIGLDPVVRGRHDFKLFQGCAEALPFVDGAVDVVITVEALDHMFDPYRACQEICRVLAPGGALFVFIRAGAQPAAGTSGVPHAGMYESDVHLHALQPEELRRFFEPVFRRCDTQAGAGYLALFGWEKMADCSMQPAVGGRTGAQPLP